MSTRSLIFVKIKPEDRRKQLSYSPSDMTAGVKFENENELIKWSKENREPVLFYKVSVSGPQQNQESSDSERP